MRYQVLHCSLTTEDKQSSIREQAEYPESQIRKDEYENDDEL